MAHDAIRIKGELIYGILKCLLPSLPRYILCGTCVVMYNGKLNDHSKSKPHVIAHVDKSRGFMKG